MACQPHLTQHLRKLFLHHLVNHTLHHNLLLQACQPHLTPHQPHFRANRNAREREEKNSVFWEYDPRHISGYIKKHISMAVAPAFPWLQYYLEEAGGGRRGDWEKLGDCERLGQAGREKAYAPIATIKYNDMSCKHPCPLGISRNSPLSYPLFLSLSLPEHYSWVTMLPLPGLPARSPCRLASLWESVYSYDQHLTLSHVARRNKPSEKWA